MTDDTFNEMKLGDLTVGGEPPVKLRKALAVIGTHLHPTFDRVFGRGVSLGSCVLVSVVLRDYFYRLGFTDAEVRSVFFYINRRRGKETVHSLGIGKPGQKDVPGHWGGHLILALPKEGWIVDATLYQAQRAQWENRLPGMIAMPMLGTEMPDGTRTVAGFGVILHHEEEDVIHARWLDNAGNNRWRTALEAKRGGKHERSRRLVSDALIEHFRKWTD
ncbi:hypothetical protein [Rhizobium sp. Root1220]|uniref:hypothetical protein n=1 Tax=Rhizobium sp. Root1220 TaxID=1736432 RepID=UPI0006FBDC93|nr:hypothetical protein [Rhizobium sp. Root1220]KQV68041.1 hypothetical protein ASC90_10275 [Rhizobium sp. Root1220]